MLEKIIKILLKHFEDQTRVISVLKAFVCSDEIEVVRIFLAQAGQNADLNIEFMRQSQVSLVLSNWSKFKLNSLQFDPGGRKMDGS